MSRILTLDVEVYKYYSGDHWAQEMFLIHGYNDVLWTSDIEEAVNYLRESLEYANDKVEETLKKEWEKFKKEHG